MQYLKKGQLFGSLGVLEDDALTYVDLKRNSFLILPEATMKQYIGQHFLKYVRKVIQ